MMDRIKGVWMIASEINKEIGGFGEKFHEFEILCFIWSNHYNYWIFMTTMNIYDLFILKINELL